ncbi:MAG TPA: hypothetical protein VF126_17035 [Acidobacteriaceae bacterium]
MRLPLLLALGFLALLAHPATADAQAAAETALTTAATSATAANAASKIRVPSVTIPSRGTQAGAVHRYTRHTAPTTVQQGAAKNTRKTKDAAASHAPHVTYRRIQ